MESLAKTSSLGLNSRKLNCQMQWVWVPHLGKFPSSSEKVSPSWMSFNISTLSLSVWETHPPLPGLGQTPAPDYNPTLPESEPNRSHLPSPSINPL
nr:hypothetical protein Iba_chr03bCG3040 [Ipomoea batatas]